MSCIVLEGCVKHRYPHLLAFVSVCFVALIITFIPRFLNSWFMLLLFSLYDMWQAVLSFVEPTIGFCSNAAVNCTCPCMQMHDMFGRGAHWKTGLPESHCVIQTLIARCCWQFHLKVRCSSSNTHTHSSPMLINLFLTKNSYFSTKATKKKKKKHFHCSISPDFYRTAGTGMSRCFKTHLQAGSPVVAEMQIPATPGWHTESNRTQPPLADEMEKHPGPERF